MLLSLTRGGGGGRCVQHGCGHQQQQAAAATAATTAPRLAGGPSDPLTSIEMILKNAGNIEYCTLIETRISRHYW